MLLSSGYDSSICTSMKCIAAYDFGTSGVKAALVSEEGELLAVREKSYPLLKPRPLYVEQNPDDFWEAVCEVTHQAVADAKIDPSEVSGLSFSVQSVTFTPVAADGTILYNAISWLDGRAEKQAEEINERCGMPIVRSQDYQSRLLWFKENEPDLYDKTAAFLDCDGFLQWKSTGVMKVAKDYPGIMKNHPAIQEYIDVTSADIDPDKLPPMVQACEKYGVLDKKGASELGLCEGTPVFGGMVDVPAAAAGCGCVNNGDAHLYLGSSGWLSAMIDDVYETSEGSYQLNSIEPGLMIYGGCTNSCCLMLNWAIDHFYAKEHEEMGGKVFDLINEEVAKVPAGSDGLIATPWLFGEQFPIADPFVRASFFNISENHTRAHFMKAVMECICYSLRGQVELYRKDTGKDLKEVGANGGGSLSDPWMQMMADVLQMPVNIPDEPRHSGAIGAAFAAAVGLGWCGFQDVKQFVKTKKTFTPDPELAELYDKRYDTFMKFYESVKTLSYDINQEE